MRLEPEQEPETSTQTSLLQSIEQMEVGTGVGVFAGVTVVPGVVPGVVFGAMVACFSGVAVGLGIRQNLSHEYSGGGGSASFPALSHSFGSQAALARSIRTKPRIIRSKSNTTSRFSKKDR